jgi:hypothetical protein
MNIPQLPNLSNQTFNSEFIEFVWKFRHDSFRGITHQLICKFNKDGTLYIEGGSIDDNGEYVDFTGARKFSFDGTDIEILRAENINHLIDIFFNNGKDLILLQKEVVEALNNL